MLARCKQGVISNELVRRLSIELKTEGLERKFKRCISEVAFNMQSLPPELAALCT
jgi:hypothetical protein